MERLSRGKALPPFQRVMVGALAAAVLIANVDQPYPEVAPLHHVPTVALTLMAPWLLWRWPLSTGSVACIFAFLLLHTLGGRYTYSNVPYDAWLPVSEWFGFTRNHYDRLVHLAFGALAMPPLTEWLRRHRGITPRAAAWIALCVVLSLGSLYEILEWLLTLIAGGAQADAYNGQQGDMWDAQKDMALAAAGAFAMLVAGLSRGGRYG